MNRIKLVRTRYKITQADLAKSLKWTQSRIANYERGIRKPSLEDSRLLVAALSRLGAQTTLDEVFPPDSKKKVVAA